MPEIAHLINLLDFVGNRRKEKITFTGTAYKVTKYPIYF
jgi:hypothetical protein